MPFDSRQVPVNWACSKEPRAICWKTPKAQTLDTYSISAGLDYASVGPEHAWLKDIGRVNYSWGH